MQGMDGSGKGNGRTPHLAAEENTLVLGGIQHRGSGGAAAERNTIRLQNEHCETTAVRLRSRREDINADVVDHAATFRISAQLAEGTAQKSL